MTGLEAATARQSSWPGKPAHDGYPWENRRWTISGRFVVVGVAIPGADGAGARQPLAGILIARQGGNVGEIGPQQANVAEFAV